MKMYVVFSLFVAWSWLAQASNFHEHFAVMTSYDDTVVGFNATGTPLDNRPFLQIAAPPTASRNAGGVIIDIFGAEAAQALLNVLPAANAPAKSDAIEDQLVARIGDLTFAQVAALMAPFFQAKSAAANADLVKRSFFEFTELNIHNDKSYLGIGWSVRVQSQEFLFLSAAGIMPMFESYFKHVPLNDRRVISLTVDSRHFLDVNRNQQLQAVKAMALRYGTRLEWFAGLPRALLDRFPDEQFQTTLKQLKDLVHTKKIDGIDVTGSIFENSPQEKNLSPEGFEMLKARLPVLYEAMGDPANGVAQIRVHSFEAADTGDYYRGLYYLLENIKTKTQYGPSLFRIGHIAQLSPADIEHFKLIRASEPVRLFFEGNVTSNMDLEGKTLDAEIATLNALAENDFEIGLGADGGGLFGTDSMWTSMLAKLRLNGLSAKALEKIQKNSQAPMVGNCETNLLAPQAATGGK